MGKALNSRELSRGITQRKDGLYQGRYVNHFGKKQTIYEKTLNEVRQKLRNEQYEDKKALNIITKEVTKTGGFKIKWNSTSRNLSSS